MKSIITEIFNGKVGCLDSMALSENHDTLSAATSYTYDNLVATLNENQKQLLSAFSDALGFENLDEVTHAFTVGVKLALRLAVESTTADDDGR